MNYRFGELLGASVSARFAGLIRFIEMIVGGGGRVWASSRDYLCVCGFFVEISSW